jgi:dTDP-glucose pyrophosphorylase
VNERLARLCVSPVATIRETMAAIDAGAAEVALLVAADDHLVALATDGDVRRALLAGQTLDAPIAPFAQRAFVSVEEGTSRADVLELMQARFVNQVPILDGAGRLRGLHLLRDLLGPEERPNPAVVMAGGKGARLRPLTARLPKPMLPVAGRPILERVVLHLVGSGVRNVHLAVNYMAETIEAHFGDGSRLGCRIGYLREHPDQPLGTGGALALLPPAVRDDGHPIIVMNGDLITQFDVGHLLAAHEQAGNAATVGLREYAHEVPFGVARMRGSRITRLEEKPTPVWSVNAGVYVIDPSLVDCVPVGREFPITELIAGAIRHGLPVGGHFLDGDWIDVGRHDELRRARGEAS